VIERVRLDLAFHLAIIRSARNPLIETMFHAIQPYTVELLLRSLTDEDVSRTGLAYHQRVLAAIADRDVRTARREMRAHLTLGLTMFGEDIDRNLNLVAQDAIRKITGGHVTFQDVLDLSRS
jgi:DNA-binding FadR family transcriptional regulator